MNSAEDLYLQIRATVHALDKLIEDDKNAMSEDVNTMSMMLVQLVDTYDQVRAGSE